MGLPCKLHCCLFNCYDCNPNPTAQVPCKLRLVALAALLRARLATAPGSCKMVVFLSTTDSVEFYHSGVCCGGAPVGNSTQWQERSHPAGRVVCYFTLLAAACGARVGSSALVAGKDSRLSLRSAG